MPKAFTSGFAVIPWRSADIVIPLMAYFMVASANYTRKTHQRLVPLFFTNDLPNCLSGSIIIVL